MTTVAALALIIWIWLLAGHGRFWQAGPVLTSPALAGEVGSRSDPGEGPARTADTRIAEAAADPRPVAVIVPARDEAGSIAQSLGSLLAQDYSGRLRVVLVDDASTDGTGEIARGFADPRLTVLTGAPRPSGWSGKLWAAAQGVEEAVEAADDPPEFLLLTDADIVHDPRHLATLVAQAGRGLDLVSEMVELPCISLAEQALIPAFVLFFQLLYPFAWVNDPLRATAAAAGGTILIRRTALARIGGIAAVRGALIDDVALARAVKRGGPIWLGHSTLARSIRRYPDAGGIWRMIARSAYVQLRCSPWRLALCLLGMALIFIVPPLAAIAGHGAARIMGALAWAGLAWCYLPTLRRTRQSGLWAPFLPLVALFYMAATLASALNHHRGRGVAWKGRAYQDAGA